MESDYLTERVALALLPYLTDELNNSFEPHELGSATEAMPAARAVLRAMRDLPDLLGNSLPNGYKAGSHSARQIWQAFIDGALAEQF